MARMAWHTEASKQGKKGKALAGVVEESRLEEQKTEGVEYAQGQADTVKLPISTVSPPVLPPFSLLFGRQEVGV
jgi:hypothetical protein